MASRADDAAAVLLTSGASGRINALFSLYALRSVWRLISAFFLILTLPFRGRRRSVQESAEKGSGKEEKFPATTGKMVKVPAAMVPRKCAAAAVGKDVAARRAMAIRRVVEGNEDEGFRSTVREFSLLTTSRGDTIFTQSWTPVKVQVRGLVVLLHGLNEHSGRYDDFAKKLNANGFKVYGMDWIGHGGSDGLHAYVHSLDFAVTDMKAFLTKVLAENPAVPCFCFGHSTGGAIVLKAALDSKVWQQIAGIVLTSPAVGVQPSHPIFAMLAPVFSLLLPRFQFSAANKRGIAVSRDPQALVAKYSDPLVFTGSIRVRTGYEILRVTSYLQQNLSRLTVPLFVLHGMADSVTDPQATRKLYEEAASTDKTIKLYEGLLHDLLFEPEKEEVAQSIIMWLNDRVRN
ncbi:alpha/beta-Hydrolases superfamily protein [Striga hermonthica]|uniref:Alpha/beta-Hydrolases superfamily protein n=1 Tax=Striga hermonthica TaxID=68872 RepID=A0A9N7RKU5_STRHE|nr:alpha/beta-Hydrolases superfamily protein [Striga hermonthica]